MKTSRIPDSEIQWVSVDLEERWATSIHVSEPTALKTATVESEEWACMSGMEPYNDISGIRTRLHCKDDMGLCRWENHRSQLEDQVASRVGEYHRRVRDLGTKCPETETRVLHPTMSCCFI